MGRLGGRVRTFLLILSFLTACGGANGQGGARRGGGCPRVAIPEEVVVEDGRFDTPTAFAIEMVHECTRGGVLEIDEFALSDLERFAFRDPPGRQLQPETSRDVRLSFMPVAGTYAYEATLRIGYGEDRVVETRIIARAHPDQDGDGVEAEQVGGTDCNDLDPRVQEASPEVDDGLDNDCDGWIDEDFVQAGSVRLTEVMAQPRTGRVEVGQWIELYNASDRTVNLRGLRLEHDEGQLILDDAIVEPGARAVVGLDADTSINGGLDLDGLMSGDILPSRPSRLVLRSDVVHTEAEIADWPGQYGISAELDRRVALRDRETGVDAWCASRTSMPGSARGTPGLENGTCASMDFDGDGFTAAGGDCDDDRAESRPGGTERWNDLDDNCDDLIDTMWIEDRMEDELGVPGFSVAVGAPDASGADRLLVEGSGELYVVGGGLWSDMASNVATASLRLPTSRLDLFHPRMRTFGTGTDVAVLMVDGRASHGPIRLLELPTGTELEADRTVVEVGPGEGPPPEALEAQDVDGDGLPELLVPTETIAIMDLSGRSGAVARSDVMQTEITLPGDVIRRSIHPVDLDDDGYGDLQVGLATREGTISLFLAGGASMPEELEAVSEAIASFQAYDGLYVVDVDGDGSREIVATRPHGVARFDGPLVGPIDATPDRELLLPAQHRMTSTSIGAQDVDGDPFEELIVVSENSAGARAWFIDSDALAGSGQDELVYTGASQWAEINDRWTWIGAMDHDGDGRDSILFRSGIRGWLQRIPARP